MLELIQESFLFWVFLHSAAFAVLNFLVYGLIIYVSAQLLEIKGNTFFKAFLVPVSIFLITFLISLTGVRTGLIGDVISFLVVLGVIKYFYEINWTKAFVLWLVSLGVMLLMATIILPVLFGTAIVLS